MPKQTEDEIIQQRIGTAMTNSDLERNAGIKADDIIKYSDLKNYSKIEDSYNHGHWVCLLRYGDTIEFFNSYGGKWDTDWRFIKRMMRMILGQNTNELTRLMNQAQKDGWKTIWNKTRFQKLDGAVQTCGRWCVFRIETMKIGYNLDEFTAIVSRLQEESGGATPDYVVSKYIK